MSLISDLAPEVIAKLENRSDKLARSYVWLRDAIIELAGNGELKDEFPEIQILSLVANLVAGTREYLTSNFVPLDGTGTGLDNWAFLNFRLWEDYPTNSLFQRLDYTSYQDADDTPSNFNALPTEWYRFGTMIGFVPTPDKPYQVQARLLATNQFLLAPTIQNITIPYQSDWNEILVWAAAERGFAELLMFEKAAAIHQLLHGDPKHPEAPGLIYSRKKKHSREDWRQTKTLKVVVSKYSH